MCHECIQGITYTGHGAIAELLIHHGANVHIACQDGRRSGPSVSDSTELAFIPRHIHVKRIRIYVYVYALFHFQ